MEFIVSSFDELTAAQLYDVLALRASVFVVEQNCAYQDVDGKDKDALHVLLIQNKMLAGYARILPPGNTYPQPAIGRVVVDKQLRRKKLGEDLMKFTINKTRELYKNQTIVISAQCYLEKFYSALGFNSQGASYLEDDIPHIKMTLS